MITQQQQPQKTPFVAFSSNGQSTLQSEEAKLAEKEAELTKQRQQLFQQKLDAEEAYANQLRSEKESAQREADAWRKQAASETNHAEKRRLHEYALEAQMIADAIEIPGEFTYNEPERKPWLIRNLKSIAASQITFLLGAIAGLIWLFWHLNAKIMAENAAKIAEGTPEIQTIPYDLGSWQKYVFDCIAQYGDLLKAFTIIAILCPGLILYIIPFFKSEKDLWHDFKSDSWLDVARASFSLLLAVFIFFVLALYHSGRPQ